MLLASSIPQPPVLPAIVEVPVSPPVVRTQSLISIGTFRSGGIVAGDIAVAVGRGTLIGSERQRDDERGPALGIVQRRNAAPMRHDDRAADREPEPQSVGLRRHERLEQPGQYVRSDPAPSVAD